MKPVQDNVDSAASSPPLSEDEIHVWQLRLETDELRLAHLSALLSPEETQRAARFRFERDRHRFILQHAALRQILASYQSCDARSICFITGPYGKPALASTANTGELSFSCSHSEDRGLVAVARRRSVGVDLEKRRPRDANLEAVIGVLSPAEQEELRRVPSGEWSKAFFNCWTCKEAFVKALGLGLSLPLDRFTISHVSGGSPELTRCDAEFTGGKRWTLLPLDLGPTTQPQLLLRGTRSPFATSAGKRN